MSYSKIDRPVGKIDELQDKWNHLERELSLYPEITHYHLAEIQTLMTEKEVYVSDNHAIYEHNKYVHHFSEKLLDLLKISQDDEKLQRVRQLWIDLLKCRNENPLQIKHAKGFDGECTFKFTLKMMEGKPYGFKGIQIFNPNNSGELEKTLNEIKKIDSIAFASHFGDLPLLKDKVLASMLCYEDTIGFIAKDQDDDIIGYCLGTKVKNVAVKKSDKSDKVDKVTVFFLMNLAKYPDFYDPRVKMGRALQQQIVQTLSNCPDIDFVAYERPLNHNFHAEIIHRAPDRQETVTMGSKSYQAQSKIAYKHSMHMRQQIIRINGNAPYPEIDEVRSDFIKKCLWQAAPTGIDYFAGGALIVGRALFTTSHSCPPSMKRIGQSVSEEQQNDDMNILKDIILSEQWGRLGTTGFFDKCIPNTIQKLQKLFQEGQSVDFSTVQQYLKDTGGSLARNKTTARFYSAVAQSSSPHEAINSLIKVEAIPVEWIELIEEKRQIFSIQNRVGQQN